MQQPDNNTTYPYEPEFSVNKLFKDRWVDLKYVLSFKKSLFAVLIAGGLLGAVTAWLWTPSYTARLTFIIDESKSGGSSGISALAGQFGFNLDALGGASGVLAGDNVQELVKSHALIKATLLSSYDGTQTLADKYAAINKLNKKWLKYSRDGKIIRFPFNGKGNTRLQDSLLHEMTTLILNSDFGVTKKDKKLDFFEINTTMKDERLALLFCERILKQATDFFIKTKTQRVRTNVMRLQHRADSIGALLNRKTYSLSAANQSLLNLNPAYTTANAGVEVRERDKIVLTTVFTETIKNLESSKAMLSQETPTVQIVDEPELPLKKNRLKYSVSIIAGVILSFLLFGSFILITRSKQD
ncbi:hypothetical protein [Mucilaginibacter sp. CSA2-8R]|uniref:hypothetical protein n=1 Tax=Mucilaginibacter sp. CSA2-8R TaxID=3141542 RepID=UPI00315C7E6E